MSSPINIAFIGAGSIQFSLNLIKDLCLTESLANSRMTLMDIDDDRLETVYRIGNQYSRQLGSTITFEKTRDLSVALKDADYVINAAFVLGHQVEALMRKRASERHGYYYLGGYFGNYHQLSVMIKVAQEMQNECSNAWLIQLGNPVFEGCTLITRETNLKVCGLCNGYQGYREIAFALDIDPSQVVWQTSGLNHNIWLTQFSYAGKNAYPLIDEWIETKSHEYWQSHLGETPHSIQMSRSAVHQYKIYGLFPIGDTVRNGGWWYQTNIREQKYWYGEPWGGPDNLTARANFVHGLEERYKLMKSWADDPRVDLVSLIGLEHSCDQTIPIIDSLTNNKEGRFQVNIPNNGIIEGIPNDVVVEGTVIVNQSGMHPIGTNKLPLKIMFERILPDWLEMERILLAFQTSDKSLLLYNLLNNHQTNSYRQAVDALDDLMHMEEINVIEEKQGITSIQRFFEPFDYLTD